jgi:hypothetical protein
MPRNDVNPIQTRLKWYSGADLTKYLSSHSAADLLKKHAMLLMKAQLLSLEEMYEESDKYRHAADDILKWFETGNATKSSR